MRKAGILFLVLGVLGSGAARAQTPAAPRELGMGGAYMGVARGFEAIFLAPGNLALEDGPAWSLGFPQVALGGALLGPGLGDLRDLAEFQDVTVDRQEQLLSLIPNGGTEGRYSLRAPVAALSVGSFGLGVSYIEAGSHSLSRDLAELFLRGYEEGRAQYSVGDTHGERVTYWDVAGAYARRMGSASFGAAVHFIKGEKLVRSQLFDPWIDVQGGQIEVNYAGISAEGGNGVALDVGFAYQALPELTISATLSNAVSSLTWSTGRSYRLVTLDRETIDNAGPGDLLDLYSASEQPYDPSSAPALLDGLASALYDGASLPPVLRVGVAFEAPSRTHLAVDFHHELGDGKLGDAWDQRLAVGIQQRLSVLGLRAGYAIGSQGGNLLSGGLTLGPLDLGVARYQHSRIGDARSQGVIATLGVGVRSRGR